MRTTSIWAAALGALFAAIGCGGGGGTAANLTPTDIRFTPGAGFTGDSSPIRSAVVTSEVTSSSTEITIVSGNRRFVMTLPSGSLADGQTFEIGNGAELEYIEGAPSSHGHSQFHWIGTVGTIKLSLIGLKPSVSWDRGILELPGPPIITTGSSGTVTDPPIVVQPVSEGGAVNASGTGTSATLGWIVGTSETVEIEPGNFKTTLTTTGGRTLEVFFTSASTNFVVGASQVEAVRLTEGMQVWNGTAGQVVVGTFTHSLNTITMAPNLSTPATGNVTLSGTVVR